MGKLIWITVAALAGWGGYVSLDEARWQAGDGVIVGQIGPGFVDNDPSVSCDGAVLVRAEVASGIVEFRCQYWQGAVWPFYEPFTSDTIAAVFMAPLRKTIPQRGNN